jgi:hypothetical protein
MLELLENDFVSLTCAAGTGGTEFYWNSSTRYFRSLLYITVGSQRLLAHKTFSVSLLWLIVNSIRCPIFLGQCT